MKSTMIRLSATDAATELIHASASDVNLLSARTKRLDGSVEAPAVLGRTGIQEYKVREFPALVARGLDGSKTLRLYRPPEEVFNPASMASFENAPLTIGHPRGGVNASNWSALAIGEVRDVAKDGDTISGKVLVKAERGIKAVDKGTKYTSNGYDFDLELEPGLTPANEAYDGVMRNIVGNHVALVDFPRGGPRCRIADQQHLDEEDETQGEIPMPKIFAVDGIPVSVDDAGYAVIEKQTTELAAARSALKLTVKVGDSVFVVTDTVKAQAAIDGLIAENLALKAKVTTPDDIAKLVSTRVKVIGDAKTLDPNVVTDGQTDLAIKRACLTKVMAADATVKLVAEAVLAGTALDSAEEPFVNAAFAAVLPIAGKTRQSTGDGAVIDAFLGTRQTAVDGMVESSKPIGRAAMIARQEGTYPTA